jgi:hypothetical protein
VTDTAASQVRHPGRALARTAVQMLPLIGVGVGAIVEVVHDVSPGWIVGWGPAATAASLILTRVMALPSVNDLLAIVGLSADPPGAHEA